MNNIEVKVVIGANYGDEGKGLATHYFAAEAKKAHRKCLNILFNGGPQRGHTVELQDGTRHVFHHFGAGTFDGADTYFDRNFMVNPMMFMSERDELVKLGYFQNKVCISPECRVITPYDMICNQIIENNRANRHGTCGQGIWETQCRYENSEFNKLYKDLISFTPERLKCYLKRLRSVYVPRRLKGIEIPSDYKELLESDSLVDVYVNDFFTMAAHTNMVSFDCFSTRDGFHFPYETIIFEAGQGLGLDEDNFSERPHVTASSTTSKYPTIFCKRNQLDNVEICYVTRSYLTRHGEGQLTTECKKDLINSEMVDLTNVPNPHQGTLRYGYFSYKTMYRIHLDRLEHPWSYNHSIMITHLNETNYQIKEPDMNSEVNKLLEFVDKGYLSDSPFSEDILTTYCKKSL